MTGTIAPDVADFLDVNPATFHPAATPEQAALLAWAAAHPTPRPAAERTGNGRYKLPDPVTGKPSTWTRCTNYAGALDDTEGLTTWRNRLLVKGLLSGVPFDMHGGLAAYDEAKAVDAGDPATLSRLAAQALHRAGEKLGADIGTALHTACEHLILGTGERPPDPWGADVDAYAACLEAHRLIVEPTYVERICITPDLGVAGTIDDIVTSHYDAMRVIGDRKTGSKVDRGPKNAIQLAIYAHATHLWRLDGEGYEPMPPVDQQTALIFHMPAGSGTCELVEVDIAKGWELAQLCGQVRTARTAKATKALFTIKETAACPTTATTPSPTGSTSSDGRCATSAPASSAPSPPSTASSASRKPSKSGPTTSTHAPPSSDLAPVASPTDVDGVHEDLPARTAWLKGRLAAISASGHEKAIEAVRKFWPADTPTPKAAETWTHAHIDAIDAHLREVELSVDALGFPPPDPTKPAPGEAERLERTAAIEATVAADPRLRPIADDGRIATKADAANLRAIVATMTADQKLTITAWMGQGKRGGRDWGFHNGATRRIAAVNEAAFAAVLHFTDITEVDESLVRAGIAVATGLDIQPAWSIGALLGSLTLDEAQRLTSLADRFAANDPAALEVIGAAVVQIPNTNNQEHTNP